MLTGGKERSNTRKEGDERQKDGERRKTCKVGKDSKRKINFDKENKMKG
jgi:hypothetical protein